MFCYEALRASDGSTYSYGLISSYIIGPFDESIFLVVKICTTSVCNCSTPYCFKTINVPFPDCDNLEYRFKDSPNSKSTGGGELIVLPNPIIKNEIILRSTLEATDFEVLNSSGVRVHRGNFNDREYKFSLNMSSGLYFIRYKNSYNKITYLKFIKL
ncbi:MAG: T9SS type A sorting domain-containing protein [Saprospiraceae bacterium]|nr:T9SS type A sorting domain-containing protein [Saprospiraceae bacterium]